MEFVLAILNFLVALMEICLLWKALKEKKER